MKTAEKTQQSELIEQGKILPLMESYYTIQGEGYNTGKPAYFIRLGGCDVGCHWCDVKESWDAENHPLISVEEMVENANNFPAKTVVITGGEPVMYNLNYLTEKLNKKGVETWLETSGAYPLTGNWHWICLSPKKTVPPVGDIHQKTDELKTVIYNSDDFRWAEEHAALVSEKCKLYLQPEWDKRDEMMPKIIEYVKQNPQWSISLQSHKYVDVP
ncbi:MAG: 7-carboxy-7-deazaguanine synthase QueE [Flavobacteriales bacterium]|nr:MAG: 7-carboxy-7-deazaguanine synthase QueE [Flavobacteriales bacterium]